jgi:pimeloyl-ACP methyl ester carboxylesterase
MRNIGGSLGWAFLHHTAIEKLERDLTDVRVVRMKACGHAPMLERPAEVANHFESFVEQLAHHTADPNSRREQRHSREMT